MSAILFGSISTIADTSELQREAFNEAFKEHGLDWRWEQDEYRALTETIGGKNRIAAYAESTGEDVDADAVHRTKSEIFQRSVGDSGIAPREGVVETVKEAKDNGVKVALVTTTSPDNVSALMDALSETLDAEDFDLFVDATSVTEPKPDKGAYAYALDTLGEDAAKVVAIEDNLGGVASAKAAGIACVAFPNANTAGHDFDSADGRVDRVSFAEVMSSAA